MKRVLLTGMSGTGKSSVIAQLLLRGYRAIDTDYGWAERGPEGDWVWPEDRIQALLTAEEGDFLFVSGCVTNQGKFYPLFDHIILLHAPTDVLIERLRTRTGNTYGKREGELTQILADVQEIEPLLRRTATAEIDTQMPLEQVVARILQEIGAKA